MNIEQIEVGENYYTYGCKDDGTFRLLYCLITSKSRWACRATLFEISDQGEREVGIWSGYPDNLHNTLHDAIEALKANVQKILDFRPKEKEAVEIIPCSNPYVCCGTCARLNESGYCTQHKRNIFTPSVSICSDNSYRCYAAKVDAVVRKEASK